MSTTCQYPGETTNARTSINVTRTTTGSTTIVSSTQALGRKYRLLNLRVVDDLAGPSAGVVTVNSLNACPVNALTGEGFNLEYIVDGYATTFDVTVTGGSIGSTVTGTILWVT